MERVEKREKAHKPQKKRNRIGEPFGGENGGKVKGVFRIPQPGESGLWNVEDFVKSKEKALTDLSPDSTGFSQYSWLNPPSLFRNVFDDILDKSFERGILIHALFYLLQGVNHRGMVSRAEFLADSLHRQPGDVAYDIFRYLPGLGNRSGPLI